MSEKFESLPESKNQNIKLEGFSFETLLGETFETIKINYPNKDVSLREAFPNKHDLKSVIEKAKKFRDQYPGKFNGVLLGNPRIIKAENGEIELAAERLHYYIYFAARQERQIGPELEKKYAALSVCGVVYDKAKNCFYMNVRPSDSQEEPNKIDAPGGILNPDYLRADPFITMEDRLANKLGLKGLNIKNIGIESIFDEHYFLYNLAMYAEVENMTPTTKAGTFIEIPLSKIEEWLKSDCLTSPAKATLLLALSQDQFTTQGWGRKRIQNIMLGENNA